MNPLHVLLRKSIDYAGLFPPAGLDMQAAVNNYAGYHAGADAWALARFVLPAARLAEFTEAARSLRPFQPGAEPWQLAALSGVDLGADLDLVARFNATAGVARIDTIELKADTADTIHDRMHRVPRHLQAYVEVPLHRDTAGLLAAIGESGARAKVRTGGVTRDAFPQSDELIRFIGACIRARIPFKATAGLHHPLRAEYRLTYAPDSERGLMFGFLNLFLAAAFLKSGMEEGKAVQVLEERSAGAFQLDETGVGWQDNRLTRQELERARQEVIVSFGSCSFTEPLSELQALHLLEPGVQRA